MSLFEHWVTSRCRGCCLQGVNTEINPDSNPHGEPIPSGQSISIGNFERPEAASLSASLDANDP
jgi:hypothetical protein